MPVPLISTKLSVPSLLTGGLRRSRLLDQIGQARRQGRRLIVLQGPAGYGKTALLAQYARQLEGQGETVIWLSLDSTDSEPAHLFQYLAEGLVSKGLDLPRSTYNTYLETEPFAGRQLVALLDQGLQAAGREVVLVLDDLHELGDDRAMQELSLLLQRPPSNLTVLIGSRSALPLSRARLRANGLLLELGPEELRFDDTESRKLLAAVATLKLQPETIEQLYAKIGGWPALTQIALDIAGSQRDPEYWIQQLSGAQVSVADYLAEELLATQSAELIDALLAVSVVDRLCESLCIALTGEQGIMRLLCEAPGVGMLIHSIDDQRYWYRIHPLLRDYLRSELSIRRGEKMSALYSAASNWFQSKGFYEEAVRYALEADELERVIELLVSYGAEIIARGRISVYLSLIRRLPVNLQASHPQLLVLQAWHQALCYQHSRSRELLAEIERQFESKEVPIELECELDAIRNCSLLFQERYVEVADSARRWLAEPAMEPPHIQNTYRCNLSHCLFYENRFEEALEIVRAAVPSVMVPDLIFSALVAQSLRPMIRLVQADVLLAEHELEGIRTWLREQEQESLLCDFVDCLQGVVLYEKGNVAVARDLFERVTDSVFTTAVPTFQILFVVARARTLLDCGDVASAIGSLQFSIRLAEDRASRGLMAAASAELVRMYCLEREWRLAENALLYWRETMAKIAGTSDWHIERWLEWAELYMLTEGAAGAEFSVKAKRLASHYLDAGHSYQFIECQLLLAGGYWRAGQASRGEKAVLTAIDKALPGGAIQPFRSAGAGIAELLQGLRLTSITKAELQFVDRVLESSAEAILSTEGEALTEPLTPSEEKVLRSLSEGMSNQKIADTVHLSVNTVKSHLKSAYVKLGVSSRTQAIKRITELQLF